MMNCHLNDPLFKWRPTRISNYVLFQFQSKTMRWMEPSNFKKTLQSMKWCRHLHPRAIDNRIHKKMRTGSTHICGRFCLWRRQMTSHPLALGFIGNRKWIKNGRKQLKSTNNRSERLAFFLFVKKWKFPRPIDNNKIFHEILTFLFFFLVHPLSLCAAPIDFFFRRNVKTWSTRCHPTADASCQAVPPRGMNELIEIRWRHVLNDFALQMSV